MDVVLESFCCIDFAVDFRLDFEDDCLSSFFDNFDRVIVVVSSAKSSRIQQLSIAFGARKDLLPQ